MAQAEAQQEVTRDMMLELDSLTKRVTHAFEGNEDKNLPRHQAFVSYYAQCAEVLDIGCGEGLMLRLLHETGVRAVGIDHDAEKVTVACSRGLEVYHADAPTYLLHSKGQYDGIFLRHVIEHFDGPEGVRLLFLCRRALRPGGTIVVITPNFAVSEVAGEIFWLDITHRRPYPLQLLQVILQQLGFEIVGYGTREGEKEKDLFIIGQLR